MRIPVYRAKIPPIGATTRKPPPPKTAEAEIERLRLMDKRLEYDRLRSKLNLAQNIMQTGTEIVSNFYKLQYTEQYNRAKIEAIKQIDSIKEELQTNYDYETWVPTFDKKYTEAKEKILGGITNPDAKKDFESWLDLYAHNQRFDIATQSLTLYKKKSFEILTDILDDYAAKSYSDLAGTKNNIQAAIESGYVNKLYDEITAKKLEEEYLHKADLGYLQTSLEKIVGEGARNIDNIDYLSVLDQVRNEAVTQMYDIVNRLKLNVTNDDLERLSKQVKAYVEDKKSALRIVLKERDDKAYNLALSDFYNNRLISVSQFEAGLQDKQKYYYLNSVRRKQIYSLIQSLQKGDEGIPENNDLELQFWDKFFHDKFSGPEEMIDWLLDRSKAKLMPMKQAKRIMNDALSRLDKGLPNYKPFINSILKDMEEKGATYSYRMQALGEMTKKILDTTLSPEEKRQAIINIANKVTDEVTKRTLFIFPASIEKRKVRIIEHMNKGEYNRDTPDYIASNNDLGQDLIEKNLRKSFHRRVEIIQKLKDEKGYEYYQIKYNGKVYYLQYRMAPVIDKTTSRVKDIKDGYVLWDGEVTSIGFFKPEKTIKVGSWDSIRNYLLQNTKVNRPAVRRGR